MAGREISANALLNDLLAYLAVVKLLARDRLVGREDREERKSEGDVPMVFHRLESCAARSNLGGVVLLAHS